MKKILIFFVFFFLGVIKVYSFDLNNLSELGSGSTLYNSPTSFSFSGDYYTASLRYGNSSSSWFYICKADTPGLHLCDNHFSSIVPLGLLEGTTIKFFTYNNVNYFFIGDRLLYSFDFISKDFTLIKDFEEKRGFISSNLEYFYEISNDSINVYNINNDLELNFLYNKTFDFGNIDNLQIINGGKNLFFMVGETLYHYDLLTPYNINELLNLHTYNFINYRNFSFSQDGKFFSLGSKGIWNGFSTLYYSITYDTGFGNNLCYEKTYYEIETLDANYYNFYTYDIEKTNEENFINEINIHDENQSIIYNVYDGKGFFGISLSNAEHIKNFTGFILNGTGEISFDSLDMPFSEPPILGIFTNDTLGFDFFEIKTNNLKNISYSFDNENYFSFDNEIKLNTDGNSKIYVKFDKGWFLKNQITFSFGKKKTIEKTGILCKNADGTYTLDGEIILKEEYDIINEGGVIDNTNTIDINNDIKSQSGTINETIDNNFNQSTGYSNSLTSGISDCKMFTPDGSFSIKGNGKSFISLDGAFDFLPGPVATLVNYPIKLLGFVLNPLNELVNITSLIFVLPEGKHCYLGKVVDIEYQKILFGGTNMFEGIVHNNYTKGEMTIFDYIVIFFFSGLTFITFLLLFKK